MADTTGGQPPTTGTERTPIALAAGNAHQGAVRTAYAAYVQHRPDCEACRAAAWQCDTAAALWEAFKAVRAADA